MPSKQVWVDYDLEPEDLEEFTDQELRKECERRGWRMPAPQPFAEPHPLHEVYYALKFGLNDRALQLMRDHICEELGVVL